jgi:RecA/RadA recombinase
MTKDEWKAIEGSPAWFRMRRNAAIIQIEKRSDRYTNPHNMAEQAVDLIRSYLAEAAKDAFFIDASIKEIDVSFYDPRDAVALKIKWDGADVNLKRRDY